MDKEAASIASIITAFLLAAFGCAAAFGLDISEGQRTAILATVGPSVLLILALGQIVRQYVWSAHSVQKVADASYAAGAAGTPPVAVGAPIVPPAAPVVADPAPPAA